MTKPTRLQEQACDKLAAALVLITEAARHDGRGQFDAADLTELAQQLARVSSAFGLDQIVARALERRGLALSLAAGTGELLTLWEGEIPPLEMLLLPDEAFRALVTTMEAEVGEV